MEIAGGTAVASPQSVLVQIVPDLRPGVSGVGDYAVNIARLLHKSEGIESVMVVLPHVAVGASMAGFRTIALTAPRSDVLLAALSHASRAVVLHYSGYGYDRNGTPRWLLEALARWKADAGNRLVTVFHELYAVSWPWHKAFWLTRSQARLSREIARISDGCLTARLESAAQLREWRGANRTDSSVQVAAIPSGVGEPQYVPPIASRDSALAVFGSGSSRHAAYRSAGSLLWRACEMLGLDVVKDLGAGEPHIAAPSSIRVVRLGALKAEEVSAHLSASRAGFLNYLPSRLSKSSVFGGYCAHGVVPVVMKNDCGAGDGLLPGHHYWYPGVGACGTDAMQSISDRVVGFHARNSVARHAQLIRDMLGQRSAAE